MTKIWFIRHAESTSNAGEITKNTETIELTEKGRLQALDLSKQFNEKPGLIVMTPYLRTQHTALPTIERFPDVQREIWDLQEFTMLSGAKYNNTNREQRSPAVKEYWNNNDPEYVDGDGAESFSNMIHRIKRAFNRLETIDKEFVAVFTHGYIMKAMIVMNKYPELQGARLMCKFQEYSVNNQINNCQIIKATVRNRKLVM